MGEIVFNKTETTIPLIDIVFQANVNKVELSEESGDGPSYENSIGFICTPCIPANVATLINVESTDAQVTLRAMAPVVDIPTVGGNRPSDVYIGLLIENNFFDQGNYFTRPEPYIDGGTEMSNTRYSIAMAGEEERLRKGRCGTFSRRHRAAQTLAQDHALQPALSHQDHGNHALRQGDGSIRQCRVRRGVIVLSSRFLKPYI